MTIDERLKDIVHAYSPAENPSVFYLVKAFKKCQAQRDNSLGEHSFTGANQKEEMQKYFDDELLEILCGGVDCNDSLVSHRT